MQGSGGNFGLGLGGSRCAVLEDRIDSDETVLSADGAYVGGGDLKCFSRVKGHLLRDGGAHPDRLEVELQR